MENEYLDNLKGKWINAYTIGGVRIQGNLVRYDGDVLFIERDETESMVYKMNLVSIMEPSGNKSNNPYRD